MQNSRLQTGYFMIIALVIVSLSSMLAYQGFQQFELYDKSVEKLYYYHELEVDAERSLQEGIHHLEKTPITEILSPTIPFFENNILLVKSSPWWQKEATSVILPSKKGRGYFFIEKIFTHCSDENADGKNKHCKIFCRVTSFTQHHLSQSERRKQRVLSIEIFYEAENIPKRVSDRKWQKHSSLTL